MSTHYALTRYPPWGVGASLLLLVTSQLRVIQPYFADGFLRAAFWLACALLLSVIVCHVLIAWIARK